MKRNKDCPAEILIAWDPDAITPEQYAELVVAIGNLVRAHGGRGIARQGGKSVVFCDPKDQGKS